MEDWQTILSVVGTMTVIGLAVVVTLVRISRGGFKKRYYFTANEVERGVEEGVKDAISQWKQEITEARRNMPRLQAQVAQIVADIKERYPEARWNFSIDQNNEGWEMTRNIITGISKYNSKKICIIVGVNHARNLEKSLSSINHKIKSEIISSKKDVDEYLNRIYRYAELNQIESLETPPLVPIFVSVFMKTKKNVK